MGGGGSGTGGGAFIFAAEVAAIAAAVCSADSDTGTWKSGYAGGGAVGFELSGWGCDGYSGNWKMGCLEPAGGCSEADTADGLPAASELVLGVNPGMPAAAPLGTGVLDVCRSYMAPASVSERHEVSCVRRICMLNLQLNGSAHTSCSVPTIC
jgi:hypothetical protein